MTAAIGGSRPIHRFPLGATPTCPPTRILSHLTRARSLRPPRLFDGATEFRQCAAASGFSPLRAGKAPVSSVCLRCTLHPTAKAEIRAPWWGGTDKPQSPRTLPSSSPAPSTLPAEADVPSWLAKGRAAILFTGRPRALRCSSTLARLLLRLEPPRLREENNRAHCAVAVEINIGTTQSALFATVRQCEESCRTAPRPKSRWCSRR